MCDNYYSMGKRPNPTQPGYEVRNGKRFFPWPSVRVRRRLNYLGNDCKNHRSKLSGISITVILLRRLQPTKSQRRHGVLVATALPPLVLPCTMRRHGHVRMLHTGTAERY